MHAYLGALWPTPLPCFCVVVGVDVFNDRCLILQHSRTRLSVAGVATPSATSSAPKTHAHTHTHARTHARTHACARAGRAHAHLRANWRTERCVSAVAVRRAARCVDAPPLLRARQGSRHLAHGAPRIRPAAQWAKDTGMRPRRGRRRPPAVGCAEPMPTSTRLRVLVARKA